MINDENSKLKYKKLYSKTTISKVTFRKEH